jgi:hypothetical protein
MCVCDNFPVITKEVNQKSFKSTVSVGVDCLTFSDPVYRSRAHPACRISFLKYIKASMRRRKNFEDYFLVCRKSIQVEGGENND